MKGEVYLTATNIREMASESAHPKESCLILLAWDYGLSLAEIRSLKVSSCRRRKSSPSVALSHGVFPMNPRTAIELDRYIQEGKLPRSSPLFPFEGSKPAVERYVQRMLLAAGERVGIPGVTLKGIRKSRARSLVNKLQVQEISHLFGITPAAAAGYYKEIPCDRVRITEAIIRP